MGYGFRPNPVRMALSSGMTSMLPVSYTHLDVYKRQFLSPAADLWSWTRYVLLFCIFFLFLMGVLNLAAPFGTPRLPMLVSSLVSALEMCIRDRHCPGRL